ncbi:hypothetical protein CGRA01v4_14770 [Colletotrichum graminicola]|nr:hypothetical protein CGRA01v4_14770 [Colletotrichum graminicola]
MALLQVIGRGGELFLEGVVWDLRRCPENVVIMILACVMDVLPSDHLQRGWRVAIASQYSVLWKTDFFSWREPYLSWRRRGGPPWGRPDLLEPFSHLARVGDVSVR